MLVPHRHAPRRTRSPASPHAIARPTEDMKPHRSADRGHDGDVSGRRIV